MIYGGIAKGVVNLVAMQMQVLPPIQWKHEGKTFLWSST